MTTVYVSLRDQSVAEFDPGAGSHTVKVRHAGSSGSFLYADAALVPSPTPGFAFVMQSPAPVAGPTWTTGQVATYNANRPLVDSAIQAAVLKFPNAAWVPTTMTPLGVSVVDGIHPNDLGMRQRADDSVHAMVAAFANSTTPIGIFATA